MRCIVLLLFALLGGAAAWGATGHYVVADVAWGLMDTSIRETIVHYFRNISMGDASPMPDAYRATPQGAWTAPLHYCDMPANATTFEYPVYCPDPPGCLLRAIYNYTDRLRKEGTDGDFCESVWNLKVEPCALEFLVHFIGDIHQPLHVGFDYDKGGNTVTVDWYGATTNLHSLWDTYIINTAMSTLYGNNRSTLSHEILGEIIANGQAFRDSYLKSLDPEQWAVESFLLARTTVYNFNSNSTPPELGDWYFNQNWPILRSRLMAAGIRLNLHLTSLFAPPAFYKRPWVIALFVMLLVLFVVTVGVVVWRWRLKRRYDTLPETTLDERRSMLSQS